jgi:hypothetical protein
MSAAADDLNRAGIRRLRTALGIARLLPAYLTFTLLRRMLPLPAVARAAWRPPRRGRDLGRAGRAIACLTRLRQLLGRQRGDCLPAALVLYRELSASGVCPTLVVGLQRDHGRLLGHAWVDADGWSRADDPAYEPTLRFGDQGKRLTEV